MSRILKMTALLAAGMLCAAGCNRSTAEQDAAERNLVEHAEAIGLGSRTYELINIDN